MGLGLSIVLGFFPMLVFAVIIYSLDRFEKEPKKLLVAVFIWGAIVAAGIAYLVNSFAGEGIYIATHSPDATQLTTGSLIAPFVEESLKGVGVLIIFFFFYREFDSLMDGLVYAGITALGFAATENIYYIYNYGFQENGLHGLLYIAFIRVVMVGWQHPFFTAFTGIGLAFARLNRSLLIRIVAPVAGWAVSVATHSLHNTFTDLLSGHKEAILGATLDWSGWVLMFGFILWTIAREQGWMRQLLHEEVTLGVITPRQYQVASSTWQQSFARIDAILRGKFSSTNRFYQLCGVLVHKKRLLATMGEEDGNSGRIAAIRLELLTLSPQVVTE